MKFGVGQSPRRLEDRRLLLGHGRYTDDTLLPRQSHAYFLRSPQAHAKIKRLDVTAAKTAPGVLEVVTGADLDAAGIGHLPCMAPQKHRDGSTTWVPPRPALATDTVRFVGDPIVLVVAETLAEARDAAEMVEIEFEELPAVGDIARAAAKGAPEVWAKAPGNVALDWDMGDKAKADELFAKAARVIELDLVNNRLAPSSMEPRMAIGEWDASLQRMTLHCGSQGGAGLRKVLTNYVFKIPENAMRVISGDVGGGFGMKIFLYPEYIGVLFAAKLLGRPVKWTGDRSEAFLADTHGRDHLTNAKLAVDANGKFLALKVYTQANLGAYLSHYGPFIPTQAGTAMLAGVYTFGAVYCHVVGYFTNTAPVDAYRGAGRPEANYVTERIVDLASRELGIAPDELRRRNFIPPSAMPYKTALDTTYDSGEFAQNLTDAMKFADWDGFPARKAASKAKGMLRGRGLITYVEACGGGSEETAQVRFDAAGGATVLIGNQSNGQGHETAYAQMVSDRLGVPMDSVRVIQGDTDTVLYPGMTGGSRALAVSGSAVGKAVERVIAKGKKIAAHMLEAAEADIEFDGKDFRVAGTDKAKSFIDVVKTSFITTKLPADMSIGIDETGSFTPPGATYPNGCHIAEVEIDPNTGEVRVLDYTVVDDFGNVMNPMMVEGQVHGGVAQGLGQALLENCVYDPETGQLLTGSFMDYAMPRAYDLPPIRFAYNEVPCRNNPLGVKGAGEAGAIGAPPSIIAAVVDALAEYGVKHIDMPATPEKVWRLIQAGSAKAAAE